MELQVGEVFVVRDIDCDVPLDRILDAPPFPEWKRSRYSEDQLEETAGRLLPEVLEAADPRAMYRILPIEESAIQDYAPPDPILEADYVASLVITVGEFPPTDDDPKHLFDDMIRDAIENSVLRVLKERVATRLHDQVREGGWNTTRLFSPGSGNVDWAVGNSKYIFETLPAEEIDVQLTRSGLIEPTKSISSVIGMGPNVQQAPNLFSCAGCPRIGDCPYAVEGDAAAAES